MLELVEIFEKPKAKEIYMIAGWHQWADAGCISSGLPQYLIQQTEAHKIGQIKPHGFYLFQVPGTHHFLRPEIEFEEGYRKRIEVKKNELFYAGDDEQGVVIFLGDEPHMNAELYAEAFFDAAEALDVQRVAIVGGVYGAMPHDKERDVSCVYSLPRMKSELQEYAVRFSDYEGGATIGSYLLDHAEKRGMELFVFYAFVPAYDFSQLSSDVQGIRIEKDYKAWYDIMRRFNYMFHLGLDLSELQQHGDELIASVDVKLRKLTSRLENLDIEAYIDEVQEAFVERPFMPLSDVWAEELSDILKDMDNDWEMSIG